MLNVFPDHLTSQHVQAQGRFVEQEDRGIVDQRAGQVQALLLPGAQRDAALPDKGIESQQVAQGIVSSIAAVFVITAIMVWAIFRSPGFAGRKRAMLIVTAFAAAASASVGLIGSNLRWGPFVSTYSGRGAGVIQGMVFFGVWLAGYRLTKRRTSSV